MLANTLFIFTYFCVCGCKEVRLLDLQKIGGATNSAALLFVLF